MSKKRNKQSTAKQYSPFTKKLLLLGAVSGSVAAITAAIIGLFSYIEPTSTVDMTIFVVGSIGIYVYGALDIKDKAKVWGLTAFHS